MPIPESLSVGLLGFLHILGLNVALSMTVFTTPVVVSASRVASL
jgi:hypothetical protein